MRPNAFLEDEHHEAERRAHREQVHEDRLAGMTIERNATSRRTKESESMTLRAIVSQRWKKAR